MTNEVMNNRILQFIVFLLISSCAPARKIIYFGDLKDAANYSEEVKNKVSPKIQPDDVLSITVSSLNPESNVLFNNGVLQTIGSVSGAAATSRTGEGYLVSKDGTINFPVLGKIALGGMTIDQATEKMTTEIKKSVKTPIINIRFLNFRITVLGEVGRPSTFTVPNEKINIIEAISLSGDLTVYGKRENILIIREKDGVRSAARVNLASKDILNSPFYYLQQNDIMYVEPIKAKSIQTSNFATYLPIVSFGISILTILTVFLR